MYKKDDFDNVWGGYVRRCSTNFYWGHNLVLLFPFRYESTASIQFLQEVKAYSKSFNDFREMVLIFQFQRYEGRRISRGLGKRYRWLYFKSDLFCKHNLSLT